ncbi:MAG: arginine--tRNA ligase [Bacteroidetes bacterium]|nr:arginine--tRNA ligase [Bacteroidota bacterium]
MLEQIVKQHVVKAIHELYSAEVSSETISFQHTNKEFEGDTTLVVFPFLKVSKKTPELTATDIGNYLLSNCTEVRSFNVVKGFLNLVIKDSYWLSYLAKVYAEASFGHVIATPQSPTVMVEYSSPNTNKPLHLGHIRNNLLGYSVAEILKAAGNNVIKSNLINDRGVHICKSMLAWQRWGNGETPESSGLKGDKLVGKYYVEFDKHYKKEVEELVTKGVAKDSAEKQSLLMQEVQEMLRKWELGDTEVKTLWETMNSWVYKGFNETYNKLGVNFDKIYYESNTYLLGKKIVDEGLIKGVFYKKEDGSVRIDLTNDGLDEKVILRSDGTSVYITQDIGTAIERFKEFPALTKLIYTVGNEQDYHFKVLFLILKKLGYKWAEECYHLSYGMVDLPSGKMKSREGTVVDADDIVDEMVVTAKETTEQLGKIDGFTKEEAEKLYKQIGLGALKFFLLKVDPKKRLLFNPQESIDFNGHTGPFIQYTFTRIQSILRKANEQGAVFSLDNISSLHLKEKELIKLMYEYPIVIKEAAKKYDPSHIANYTYELAKVFNQFYHECSILKEENANSKSFRLCLSNKVAEIIRKSMLLLGIEMPERM